jgi:membrane associated rhomboid family serine protease
MSSGRYSIRLGGPITPAVKGLIITNAVVFLLQQIGKYVPVGDSITINSYIYYFFGLSHNGLVINHYFWQLFSYMFLHEGWAHIIFNLLGLWMFAGDLENLWGTARFIRYYIICGIGAGICIALVNAYMALPQHFPQSSSSVTIGASGAIFALLLAYGMTWPNKEVLIFFVVPVKIKYFLIFFGVFSFFATLDSIHDNTNAVSHIAHLGGILVGFVILQIWLHRKAQKIGLLTKLIKQHRLKRKKKVIDSRIKAKQMIDDLLEKIAREGISSLTEKEKKDLEWARKNYYPTDEETIH